MPMDGHSEIIAVGCLVEVILKNREGQEEHLTCLIVPPEAADYSHGFLGANTALAQALLGESRGAIIPYLKDDIYSIEVISVTKSDIAPPKDAAEKREASLRKAMKAVEDTNAMVFASSFSGKWGDYDPDSIPKEAKTEESE